MVLGFFLLLLQMTSRNKTSQLCDQELFLAVIPPGHVRAQDCGRDVERKLKGVSWICGEAGGRGQFLRYCTGYGLQNFVVEFVVSVLV